MTCHATACDRLRSARNHRYAEGSADPLSVLFYIIFNKFADPKLYLIRIARFGSVRSAAGFDA